ncbi:helix-turn-helix domain-containing protein [Aquibium oceanicum]|uniref:HTH cro/C1-type domain-containing protein n=1 Tax=Aquibium oceanicum TaxID=1670800 RepID=A0A1L3SQ42_9HYPH|nr:helix-turn-helix transcriptional regulator [Aquibium oceanicum]APH71412.1 hypothetical protein BSQ44_08560 [Aquibium oceanicum]
MAFRPYSIPPRAHPLVRRLFALMNDQRIALGTVAERSGVAADTIKDWRGRTNPSVPNLEACFNALGYGLTDNALHEPVVQVRA